MRIRSHHFMANRWGNNGNSERLYFGGSKITADDECSHEIKRRLLLGRKAMTNLDSILKSRGITLLAKARLAKAVGFPAVVCGHESWAAHTQAQLLQACRTHCDSTDCSPPASSVHGILQARILEWDAISFSRGSSNPGVSCIAGRVFTTEPLEKPFKEAFKEAFEDALKEG